MGQEVSKTWDRLRLHILLIEFDYKICTSDSATYGEVMAGRPQLVALEEQLSLNKSFVRMACRYFLAELEPEQLIEKL